MISIRKLEKEDTPPYHLLLLADPSMDQIDKYFFQSEMLAAYEDDALVGICVLKKEGEVAEIMNLAVLESHQGEGIGTLLIEAAEKELAGSCSTLIIATADSSIRQLKLYKKLGFKEFETLDGYFLEHYDEPIFEGGIPARHMIRLKKELT